MIAIACGRKKFVWCMPKHWFWILPTVIRRGVYAFVLPAQKPASVEVIIAGHN